MSVNRLNIVPIPQTYQSINASLDTRLNSCVLCVISVARCAIAVPAFSVSRSPMGRRFYFWIMGETRISYDKFFVV